MGQTQSTTNFSEQSQSKNQEKNLPTSKMKEKTYYCPDYINKEDLEKKEIKLENAMTLFSNLKQAQEWFCSQTIITNSNICYAIFEIKLNDSQVIRMEPEPLKIATDSTPSLFLKSQDPFSYPIIPVINIYHREYNEEKFSSVYPIPLENLEIEDPNNNSAFSPSL